MTSPRKVIVFGPTGAVGSSTALTASSLGASVVLAMRDTSKAIRGLTTAAEEAGSFQRIEADLNKPETVRSAVESTGAKHAFFYLAMGSPDHMRATVEALKAGGVESVVFLSSFTVHGELAAIEPADLIPYMHARVEMSLRDVFGEHAYVAARPGAFASNTAQYKAGLQAGEVGVFGLQSVVDCIVPADIGRVCGTVLAHGPPADGQRHLYLYGPRLYSQEECVGVLARGLAKEPKIVAVAEQDAHKLFGHMPPALVDYMIRHQRMPVPSGELQVFGYPVTQDQLSNVERYSGSKATTFPEWVEQNKQLFLS